MNQMKTMGAGMAVAVFEGYVDGEPLVKWRDRGDMPKPGEKLYSASALHQLLEIIAAAYQVAAKHGAPAQVLDVLADPSAATSDQVAAMLPYQVDLGPVQRESSASITETQVEQLWARAYKDALAAAGLCIGNADEAHNMRPLYFARAIERVTLENAGAPNKAKAGAQGEIA